MITTSRIREESFCSKSDGIDQTSMLSAALKYAEMGFRIVPCHAIRNKNCTCRRKECPKPGKHPRIKQWPKLATCELPQNSNWFAKWPDANFGVATGTKSGIIVLDFDGEEGLQTLKRLTASEPAILETRIHQTGSGGKHLIYLHPGFDVGNSVRLLPGMDVRGDRGLIILPPSIHQSGGHYAVANSLPIASLPPALFEIVRDRSRCCHKESLGVLKKVEEKQSELKQEKKKKEVLIQQLPDVPIERIEFALRESLPQGPGRRNRQIFQLARHLQAIDGITQQIPASAFRFIVERWHRMLIDKSVSMGFNVTGDFEETLAEFRYAWPRVKHPIGATLQPIFDKAAQQDADGEVLPVAWNSLQYYRRTEHRSMRILTAVLFELARKAGDDSFSLACDAGAFQFKRIGVTDATGKWLHRRLQNLVEDEVIKCVDRGQKGRQTERKPAKYLWIWTMRELPNDGFR